MLIRRSKSGYIFCVYFVCSMAKSFCLLHHERYVSLAPTQQLNSF
jgi:hypothetical protein